MEGWLVALLLAQSPWWAPSRASSTDAGASVGVEATTSTSDGGVDGGARPTAPRERWSWQHADGGWLDDAGLTDRLRVGVGETAELVFAHPVVQMQCDAQLLRLDGTAASLLLTGAAAGHTHCGFWYFQQSWPHRYLDVTVTPAR